MNKNISSVLEAFYLTTKLPIICINNKGTLVGQYGYKNDMLIKLQRHLYNEENILHKELINKDTINYFTVDSSCELAMKHIIINNLYIDHFFYIGPYRTTLKFIDTEASLLDYQYRPRFCISYLFELLRTIINDTITSTQSIDSNKHISLNVRKAIKYINDNYDDELTIDLLSKKLNINKCYFCNIFKKETGVTFSNFLNKVRIEKSKSLLSNSSLSVLDVAVSVGFNNQNYFSMAFKKELGITPLQYRREFYNEKAELI